MLWRDQYVILALQNELSQVLALQNELSQV